MMAALRSESTTYTKLRAYSDSLCSALNTITTQNCFLYVEKLVSVDEIISGKCFEQKLVNLDRNSERGPKMVNAIKQNWISLLSLDD